MSETTGPVVRIGVGSDRLSCGCSRSDVQAAGFLRHRPGCMYYQPVTVQVGNGTGDCGRLLANHCGWGMPANCGIHGTVRQIAR